MSDSKTRVREWRQKKKEEGGKAVHVVLSKNAADTLLELRDQYKGYSNAEIFSLALEVLREKTETGEIATDSDGLFERISVLEDNFKNLMDIINVGFDRQSSLGKRVESLEAKQGELFDDVTTLKYQVAMQQLLEQEKQSGNEVVIDSNVEELKDMAMKMKEEGLSNQKIADVFNEEEIPTFSGKGKWHKKTIYRLLTE
jgi:hypothetical protein